MQRILLLILILCSTIANSYDKKSYNIGLLADTRNEDTKKLTVELQHQISAVVGEDAEILFPKDNILVNNYDLNTARENYQKLLASDTDIIIAFGVINNEVIRSQKEFIKPTILFGANNQDINEIDVDQATSGIKNFTYLVESESYKDDISKLYQLVDFKNIGIAIDKSVVDYLPIKPALNKIAAELDINYQLIPFTNIQDIINKLDSVDAMYLAGGFFLKPPEVKQLAAALMQKKIPSFTINGIKQVENGIMASHQAQGDINQFFRRIALTIESYINGTPLAQMPLYIEYTSQLTINYNTAELVGLNFTYGLIDNTDFVGDFKNAMSKQNLNLIEVINQGLKNNLSLQSNKKDTELSLQNLRTAKSAYLPDVSISTSTVYIDPNLAEISGGTNPEISNSGALNIGQTIYSNAASANIEIQRRLLNAELENYNIDKLDTIFTIANAYFNILISKANGQIQLENLKLTKNNLKLATQNFTSGKTGKADMLRFRSEKAQNTQSMIEAGNQLDMSFIGLNQLLNNPVDYEIDIIDIKLDEGVFKNYNYNQLIQILSDAKLREPFIVYLTQQAIINAPELKVLDHNIAATNRDIKLNGASRFIPTISLQGQYNNTFSRSGIGSTPPSGSNFLDDNYNMALTFSVPLFNKNQFNINRQKAIIQQQKLDINKQNTNLAITTNIRIGVLNLVNQMTNMKLSKVSEVAAQESLELIKASYENGALTIADLLDAQKNHTNAQLANNNAIYNFLIQALQLERYMGYYFLLGTEEQNVRFKNKFLKYMQESQEK